MTGNDTIEKDNVMGEIEPPVQDVIELNVNTDGRKPYEWMSKYPDEARAEMRGEIGRAHV